MVLSHTAHAYMFNDPIGDRIGGAIYEIYGMDIKQTGSNFVFDLFSNYTGSNTVGAWTTLPADFAISVDGDSSDYEYGVAFRNHSSTDNPTVLKGDLYRIDKSLNNASGGIVNGWYISDHYAPSAGYGYNHDKPVGIGGGTWLKNVNVTWNSIGMSPDWKVSFALEANDFLVNNEHAFDFFVGSATCANDFMDGHVNVIPEPASIIMMIMGLFGFGFFKKRV